MGAIGLILLNMTIPRSNLPAVLRWTPLGRAVVFFLAAASIWCLLVEFYGLCSMRTFTLYVLIPATIVLVLMALLDFARGDRRLFRAVMIGAIGGLIAAFAYDIFRLPFVIAAADHTGPPWLRLPLFKVFPRFGAMILGQPFTAQQTDSQFTLFTHVVGWAYHFSNGITFGVMYMALVGEASRRSWWWAIVLAVGLELAMLFTPYTGFFGIGLTARFVIVTLSAHLIFGIALGKYTRREARRWPVSDGRGFEVGLAGATL
ncbi:MAG: hypothetical protein JWL69_746 [Phycisphaerales bacterium]|nr:hypothetical protein [Phycisphaerales bacterium]